MIHVLNTGWGVGVKLRRQYRKGRMLCYMTTAESQLLAFVKKNHTREVTRGERPAHIRLMEKGVPSAVKGLNQHR